MKLWKMDVKLWKMDEKAIRKMVWLNVFLTLGTVPCLYFFGMHVITEAEQTRDLQNRVEQFALRLKEAEDRQRNWQVAYTMTIPEFSDADTRSRRQK